MDVALFSDTINLRNLKLGTVVVCDGGFPKTYVLINFHEGRRLSGAKIRAKLEFFKKKKKKKNRNCFRHYGECMNETSHAHRRHLGLVCCIMFAHLTEVKGHQEP